MEAKQSSKRAKTVTADQPGLFPEDMIQTKAGHAKRDSRMWDKVMVAAKKQAEDYARALPVEHGYPPFILVLDVGNVLEVFADFSGQGKNYAHFPDRQTYRLTMDDLLLPEVQDRLRAIWTNPESLDPTRKSAEVTRDIAERLAVIAKRLEVKHAPQDVAEFLMRCVFTMFAEDVGLLPPAYFEKLLDDLKSKPASFVPALESLWETMDKGAKHDRAMGDSVRRFNGKLFHEAKALPLDAEGIHELWVAAKRDWQHVEPAIFGTLVERALDADERSRLGAHYTPRAYVERLVIPTIIEPLRSDWETVSALINDLLEEGKQIEALRAAKKFHRQLCTTRVLDPACGTGNFLYVSLELMKRLEGEVLETITSLGGSPDRYSDFPNEVQGRVGRRLAESGGTFTVDPHQFFGIEINPRAAAIATLVLWLGFLKWQIRTGGTKAVNDPVLDSYGSVIRGDAILAYDREEPVIGPDGKPLTRWDGVTRIADPVTGEMVPDPKATKPVLRYHNFRKAEWPEAEFIVGNPPFIGGKDMRVELGDGYAEAAWAARPHIPGGADFVMHFWDAAAERLLAKGTKERPNPLRRFGFITTNSITQVFSRRVIENRMEGKTPLSLLYAIPDHPWLKAADKAAVRIAMTVAVAGPAEGVLAEVVMEDGLNTDTPSVDLSMKRGHIKAGLTLGADMSAAKSLWANEALCSPGVKLHGSGFIVTPAKAQQMGLGKVPGLERHIRLYRNGRDLADRPREVMVIDLFGLTADQVRDRFPAVFAYLAETVKVEREGKVGGSKDLAEYARQWWIFGKPRSELRPALQGLPRYIATIETAKHRFFQFLDASVLPDNMLVNIASPDSRILSVMSSRVSVLWMLGAGGTLEDRPRYNKTRTFDPFPFPAFIDMFPDVSENLATLGEKLDAFRKDRIATHPHLTMTGLYNVLERVRELAAGADVPPLSDAEKDVKDAGQIAILRVLHDDIDRAVLDAFGWSDLAPALVGRPGATTPSPHKSPGQIAAEEELLSRLVDLNQTRAAAEAKGEIEWLRPEYQVPRLRTKAPQAGDAKQTAAVLVGLQEEVSAFPWPSDGLEQIRAVRSVLATASSPLAPEDIARRFRGGRNRTARVETVLRHMVDTGLVRVHGRSHFIPRG